MENIVPLQLVPQVEPIVNREAIELVEELLADVRSGQVLAVGLVAVHQGGGVAISASQSDQYHRLNSGAARLAAKLALE